MPGHPFTAPRPNWFRLRRSLHRIAARCAACLNRCRRGGEGAGILTYHRVVPDPGRSLRSTWGVTPDAFEQQLVGLLAQGYRALPLAALVSALDRGGGLPKKAFVVTFDDGYQNNFRHAWPILQRHGVPATIFLATQYVGGHEPFPFEDWPPAAGRQAPPDYWQPLSLEQCLRMREGGLVQFGSHTHSHQCFLGRLPEFRADLAESLRFLDQALGIDSPPFSYPFGAVSADLVLAVQSSGLPCALTTRAQPLTDTDSRFELGRFGVEHSDTPRVLAAKLDGRYSSLCRAIARCLAWGARGRSPRPERASRQWWSGMFSAAAGPRSSR